MNRLLPLTLGLLMALAAGPTATADATRLADAPAPGVPDGLDAPTSDCPFEGGGGVQRTLCQVMSCWSGPLRPTFVCTGDPCTVGSTDVCVSPCEVNAGPVHDCTVDLPDPCERNVNGVWEDCTLVLDPCARDVGPLRDCQVQCFSNSPFECLGICNGGVGRLICYPGDVCDRPVVSGIPPCASTTRGSREAAGLGGYRVPSPALLA